MKQKRKSISKKLRFEIFKRDEFKCQYCGKSAPDVILEIDHILPVCEGGENDLINLRTSCFDCNRGKGKRLLNDKTLQLKQQEDLDLLINRNQQLEMLIEWRTERNKSKDLETTKVLEYLFSNFEFELNSSETVEIEKSIKKFGIIKVLDSSDKSYKSYNRLDKTLEENKKEVVSKIFGILYNEAKPDYSKKISYIYGILKNKGFYINRGKLFTELNKFYKLGNSLDELIQQCKNDEFKNWTKIMLYLSDMNNITENE